jgi:hypothetical protein
MGIRMAELVAVRAQPLRPGTGPAGPGGYRSPRAGRLRRLPASLDRLRGRPRPGHPDRMGGPRRRFSVSPRRKRPCRDRSGPVPHDVLLSPDSLAAAGVRNPPATGRDQLVPSPGGRSGPPGPPARTSRTSEDGVVEAVEAGPDTDGQRAGRSSSASMAPGADAGRWPSGGSSRPSYRPAGGVGGRPRTGKGHGTGGGSMPGAVHAGRQRNFTRRETRRVP